MDRRQPPQGRPDDGRLRAYVYHLPDTACRGQTNFTRYFFAQGDKQAVVVDERFNSGGALATDVEEFLTREMMSGAATRDGGDEVVPRGRRMGPHKVMLVNEFAGSGGPVMVFPPSRRGQIGWQAYLG